jgi:chemotaxis protein methyltransferase CheR
MDQQLTSPTVPGAFPLDPVQFAEIGSLIRTVAGIDLHPGKEGLVQIRLASRIRTLGLTGFDGYLNHLRGDASGVELSQMVDLLTTNKTSFFREPEHFRFLQTEVLPPLVARGGPIRIWSAGCSTGEEPYSLAIVTREALMGAASTARIHATDV